MTSDRSGATARRVAWGVIGACLALGLAFGVHPWYDPTNDGSMYLITARALAAGEGYTYLGEPFVIRPPGFPALLAPLVALRGTDFHALNLFVSATGALGVVLFHLLLRPRLGLLLATLVPLVLWFNPGHQRMANQVMSDVPGWTLLVACLLLARQPWARTPRGAFGLGLALGLAALVRSANVLLVPALVAYEGLQLLPRAGRAGWKGALRRCAALALGALLVSVPWSVRNQLVRPPPPAEQTTLYSYSTALLHTDLGDPASPRVTASEFLGRFPRQMSKSLHSLGTRLGDGAPAPHVLAVALLLLGALLVSAVRRRAPEDLWGLAMLGVVAFYFAYAGRLMLPLFALAIPAAVELARDLLARFLGARAGLLGAALLCLAWIAVDWAPRAGWKEIEGLHEAQVRLARQVNERLPPEARLGAYRAWHHSVYLERPVHGFEPALARAGNPGERVTIARLVERHALDAILLGELGLPDSVAREERAFAAAVAAMYGGPQRGLVPVR
ncbi:MAG TPA: hypothetical protein VF530_08755 [Planctomycetota bacterium]